ncbi:MAG: InlB B-repeat-containing protein [Paludibacteraceae bacterium]|nr:InlB B-repeat-containing protein [Paludibacteraceae bacterium]
MKNINFSQKQMHDGGGVSMVSRCVRIVKSLSRTVAVLTLLLTLGVGQMWAANEYNKRYLYVNSSNCSWWTDASAQPALNAYFNTDCSNDWAAFQEEASGALTSTSWYFDLSGMHSSYLYFRGFKIERHPKNTGNYWNTVTAGAENNGTHNCLWINSDGGGMSWGNYAVPISSITLSATSGYLSGSGTSGSPYLVPVGTNISLSASPTCTPADGTMSFCANFGTSPAASPTTVTSTGSYSVSSTSKVEVKCKGRNKYGDVYSADVTSNSIYVQGVVPSVGVSSASSVTTTTATLNASVTVNGATTTAYGFKYGTTNNVATLQASGTDASTSGALAANATSFSRDITSLSPSTTYYYISYVTTASGTYYSASTQSFTTATPAEPTHNVTVYYKYNSSDIQSSATESAVGESTPRGVTAPSITGYTFSYWSLGNGLTNESGSTTANPISITTKASGTYTLTANYTINSYTVTFNAMSGSGSMSNESFNYNQTNALTTNAYTRSGYVFKGWATSSANATAGTVAYADGANYTMGSANVTLYAVWYKKAYFVNVPKWTAANVKAHVYTGGDSWQTWNGTEEKMTSTGTTVFGYTIYSYEFPDTYTTVIFHNNGANQTDAWTWSSSTPYYYHGAGTQYASVDAIRQAWKVYGSWNMTGEDWNSNDFSSYSANTATYTVSLVASTTYNFKYVFAGTNTWYGSNGGSMSDGDTWTLNGSSDVSFTTTIAGTYTFTIDYSGMNSNSAPSCTVDFPVSYTLTYDIGTVPGNDGSISCATASGSYVPSGNTVTLTGPAAKTGYTWKGWFTNAAGTTGQIADVSRAITVTMNADKTLYACYTENTYSTNVAVTPAATGSITSPTPSEGKINVSHHTGTSVTASANTNYVFDHWSVADGGLTVSSTTSNPATFKATGTGGTITANFADQWALTGIGGDWDTYYGLPYKSANVYEGSVTLTADNHTFKVVDRKTSTYYTEASKTITRAANTANAATTGGTGNEMTITADKAGTYTFNYNTSTHVLTVTYPADPTYTVTVTAGAHGTITTPTAPATTVSAGEFTPAAIAAAVADYGYYFSRWTVESGSATFGDETSASTTVNATSNATIKANFVSHWTVAGGDSENNANGADAMGNWNETTNGIDNFTEVSSGVWVGYADIDLPANTTFYFKIRDLFNTNWYGNTGEMTIGNHTNWTMATDLGNCRITTAGAGTYRFTWNETNKQLTVTYPTSYTVTYGKTVDNGQDIGGVTATGDDGDALTSGKYVAKGTATFTAAAAANYHFVDWRTSGTYGEGTQLSTDNPYTMTSIAANKTVYAHYAENMTDVTLAHTGNGHIEIGGATVTSTTAGTVTTRTITAVPDAGWYFAGWTVSDGADCNVASTDGRNDNEPSSTTLSGLGTGTTGTVTANFVENDKVYFRNWNDDADAPLWENVYVYFNISFEDDCAKSSTNSSYIVQMTQIGESNVYWAYVPRTVYNVANIAFSNHEFGTNYKFYQYEAVKRGDYNRSLSMFVPRHSDTEEQNSTKYYKGYWKHYGLKAGSDAGYRIERYNGSTYEQPSDNGGDRVKFLVVNDNTIEYQLRVDNQEEGHNNYMIYSEAGIHYITFDGSPVVTGYTVTTASHSDIGLTEYTLGSPRFYITPTSEGVYKLVIDMSHDMMRLSVIYPVAVGDYMLVHNYNDGSAKISRSDIIKPDEVSSRLYSMYIDNITAHTKSLKFKKCTALTEGVPVWSAGNAVSMSGFKADTAGVFQFNVAIAADNATLSDIATYHGNYYIKTDCADGGWTAYKSNILEHNSSTFSTSDSKTYDYYFCRWVESDMYDGDNNTNFNVKCVVANDYNNALSDTLTGDAIIGVNNDVLPYNANVRFSYNSVTNELRRAYINGATDWQESFLRISAGDASQIRSKYTHTAYSGNDTTLTDKNNWIYQLDLEAHTNARVKLTANYRFHDTDHEQYFKGNSGDYTDANTEQIIQGTSADTWFPLRVVYDFKIDKLIAGYLPGNTNVTSSEAIYSDVLIIRNGQGDGTQLTFGTGKELSNVKTVYGVMEFNKSDIQNAGLSRYARNTYWVSFPFDVRLDQVTGFGDYGKEWIIQYYDGATRAEKGAWKDSPNFWTYVMPSERNAGFVMKANEGYLVSLSLNNMTPNDFWKNGVTTVSLYFPSKDPVGTINGTLPSAASYVVPEHPCTIERDGRYFKDANWNIIGVPSYANLTRGVQEEVTINGNSVSFLYRHNTGNNHMEVQSLSGSFTFGVMKSYMVQYAGTINWTSTIPSEVAARRAPESDNKTLDLQILDGEGQLIDRAFVRFSDESTDGLDLNKDLYKFFNEGGNVYTLCSDVELAAQILPLGEGTLSIPVGVKADGNATVEFAMPEGTEGMEVYLYDKQDGTYTNLLTSTRTVNLTEGKTNDRFILMVKEAKMPTAVISTEQDAENTVKYLRNGHLFIKRGGRLYNAEGKFVNNVK